MDGCECQGERLWVQYRRGWGASEVSQWNDLIGILEAVWMYWSFWRLLSAVQMKSALQSTCQDLYFMKGCIDELRCMDGVAKWISWIMYFFSLKKKFDFTFFHQYSPGLKPQCPELINNLFSQLHHRLWVYNWHSHDVVSKMSLGSQAEYSQQDLTPGLQYW